jgi:hypothetical protein
MRTTLAVLGVALTFMTVALAQSNSPISNRLILGPVEDPDFGCGCWLSRTKLDGRNRRFVFMSPLDGSAYINLNQKTITLRLIAESRDKKRGPRVGDRSWAIYSDGNVRLRIDYIVTTVCDPKDESCEVTYYNAIMTVTRNQQKAVVHTSGLCGC